MLEVVPENSDWNITSNTTTDRQATVISTLSTSQESLHSSLSVSQSVLPLQIALMLP